MHFGLSPSAIFSILVTLVTSIPKIQQANDTRRIRIESHSAAETALHGVSARLHQSFTKAAGLGEHTTPSLVDDPDLEKYVRETLKRFFLLKGDSVFTQRISGQSTTPVQIESLVLQGPLTRPISAADRLNGIDLRVHFSVKAAAWRSFSEGNWGEWKPSAPPLLSSFVYERKNGTWTLAASPSNWYGVAKPAASE